MKLYGAIDLHSNNNYTVIIDEQDRAVFRQKLINEMDVVLTLGALPEGVGGSRGGVDL